MKKSSIMSTKNIFKILFSSLIVILTAIIFYGIPVLNYKSPLFQIPFFGLVISLGLTFFNEERYKEGILLMILIFVIQIILLKFNFIVTHLIYFILISLSTLLFSRNIYNKLKKHFYILPIIFSILLGTAFLLSTLILTLIYNGPGSFKITFINVPIGLYLGFTVIVGFQLSELIINKFQFK